MSYPPPGGGQDPSDPYQPPPTGPESGNPYAQPTPPPAYPQPYGQPYGQYPAVPAASGNNGLSIASMVTGIVSIPLGCCCPLLSIAGGGAAIGMGFVGLKQTRERGQGGRGMAIAGIATGAAGLILGIIMLILGVTNSMSGWLNDLNNGSTSDDDFDFD